MSKLEQAGESTTASPSDASPAAVTTASSIEAARRTGTTFRKDASILSARLADEHGAATDARHGLRERRIVAALVAAARDEDDAAGEPVERGDDGAHVRALRVVVVEDTPRLRDQLHAVREPALELGERAQGLGVQVAPRRRLASNAASAFAWLWRPTRAGTAVG